MYINGSSAVTHAENPQLSGLITQNWNVCGGLNIAALPFLLSPGQQSPNIDCD